MMTWMRIKLDQIDHDEPSPLVVTAPIGSDKRIALNIPFAGWWGSLKRNAWIRPIIFKPDGTVAFAGDPEDGEDERQAHMQIFGAIFELGAEFYMEDKEMDEVSRFVVREMTELKA